MELNYSICVPLYSLKEFLFFITNTIIHIVFTVVMRCHAWFTCVYHALLQIYDTTEEQFE